MEQERKKVIDIAYQQVKATLESAVDRREHIRGSIIPRMDQRRGRRTSLGRLGILKRLFSVDPHKPGEIYEILFETKPGLTPSRASEVADIVYYVVQPECPEYLRDPSPFLSYYGIDIEQAYSFCILKYETRLSFGNEKDYKEIENGVLERFLVEEALIPQE